MKPSLRRLTTAVAFGTALLMSGVPAVGAEQPAPAGVAFVNVQMILSRSTAARDLQAQVEKQRQKYQAEIAERRAELMAQDQELASQRALLSPEVFAEKRREFETRVAEVQRTVQARKKSLDQAYAGGMGQVRQAMIAVISEIARERGINLVLSRGPVLFADSSLNLSEDVLRRLDEQVPAVTLPGAGN